LLCVILASEPVKNAMPAGFQKIAAELSASPVPDSPIPPALESGANSKKVTAASPCALILLLFKSNNIGVRTNIINNFFILNEPPKC